MKSERTSAFDVQMFDNMSSRQFQSRHFLGGQVANIDGARVFIAGSSKTGRESNVLARFCLLVQK